MSEKPFGPVEMYVDTSHGLMLKFAQGGVRRATDEEKAKMLAALATPSPVGADKIQSSVSMPRELSDAEADAALRATAVWLEVKGSQLTVNREKMKSRYRSLVKFIEANCIKPGPSGAIGARTREIDNLIQRHASAYVARGSAINDAIIAECKASRQALRDAILALSGPTR